MKKDKFNCFKLYQDFLNNNYEEKINNFIRIIGMNEKEIEETKKEIESETGDSTDCQKRYVCCHLSTVRCLSSR